MTSDVDGSGAAPNWYSWHAPYDDLESVQTERLGAVQETLRAVLDDAPAGPLRAVSICSGQARDLLPILISHPRGPDLRVRMIELDPLNASFLRGALGSTGLTGVEVLVADAGRTDAYTGAVPADLVLISGPFAHISSPQMLRTISMLPQLCAPGAVVVWSVYGPGLADLDVVLDAFAAAGFGPELLAQALSKEYAVGASRFEGEPVALRPGQRLFTFDDD